MRSWRVIAAGSLVLVAVGTFLIKTGPKPREGLKNTSLAKLATASKAEDSLGVLSSAIAKEASQESHAGHADAKNESSDSPDLEIPEGMGKLLPGQETAYKQAPPLSAEEIRSVEKLVSSFIRPGRGRAALNRLVADLDQAGLQPVMAKSSNPFTGKMLTIRTNETLEGTKYYHATYFEDEDQGREPYPQHRSFEIRGSSDCMKRTQEAVEKMLGKNLGTPSRKTEDKFVEWQVGDETVWIHRLGLGDILHDPYNARTLADIGNCKAAIELKPEVH